MEKMASSGTFRPCRRRRRLDLLSLFRLHERLPHHRLPLSHVAVYSSDRLAHRAGDQTRSGLNFTQPLFLTSVFLSEQGDCRICGSPPALFRYHACFIRSPTAPALHTSRRPAFHCPQYPPTQRYRCPFPDRHAATGHRLPNAYHNPTA